MALSPKDVIPYVGRYMLPDVLPVVVDLEKSNGARLVDSQTGTAYLDCISYIASQPVGHNHPKMFDPEFERKLLRAARTKPSNSDFYTVELAEFVEAFAKFAMPPSLVHLFMVEGGGVAVENALKTAFDWKVRLNFSRGVTAVRGQKVIHFRESFHGRTGYAMNVTATPDERKTKYYPRFDWPCISNPKVVFPLDAANIADVSAREQAAIADLTECLERDGEDVAAIIIEPVQGEGGDNHFRAEFHQALRRLADEYDVILIYDEVQSGMGLSGKMWAYQHYGMEPDIIAFGKKSQVCGILASKRIDVVPENVFVKPGRLNSTWGGSLVDMVRAQRYLEIMAEEALVENAAVSGQLLINGLAELCRLHPHVYSNGRGLGLMCAVDVDTPDLLKRVLAGLFERQVLALKSGARSLRFRPPLVFSRSDVAELLNALDEVARIVCPK